MPHILHAFAREDDKLQGATLGGSVIKSGWIGMGLRLELAVGSKRITTSPVKFLAIE